MYLPVIFSTVVHSQKVYHIRTIVHNADSDSDLNVGFLGCVSLLSPVARVFKSLANTGFCLIPTEI